MSVFLGRSDFVGQILSVNNEAFKRRYALKARGVDLNFIAGRLPIFGYARGGSLASGQVQVTGDSPQSDE
jgi:hypothetical protein